MELVYYNDKKGNIGDELNVWLWPKIFGDDFFKNNNDTAFLGIGSIIMQDAHYIKEAEKFENKIIFGSGVRSLSENLEFDKSWNISFLRGPLSSLSLSLNKIDYITDAAYYLALTNEYSSLLNTPKKYKIGVIPYYKSLEKINWEKLCEINGWKLINVASKDVENFLQEVSECELILAEAMHGAIIADILRIPWKRMKFFAHEFEKESVSEFKWKDWLFSLDIRLDNHYFLKMMRKKKLYKILPSKFYDYMNERKIMSKSIVFDKNDFNLSSEEKFEEIVGKLKMKRDELVESVVNRN